MAAHFRSPEVFAVTAKVFEEDPPVFATGGKYGRFRRGFWSAYFNYDIGEDWIGVEEPLLSFYAVGGFATFDRQKLNQLGGFLEILSPFHWEDIDLSYRAWKRGWDVHFEPQSRAHHKTSATINAHYDSREVETASFRNRLLFHWINLHCRKFLLAHLTGLAVLFLTRFLVGDWGFYAGLRRAVGSLPEALRLRREEKHLATRTDQDLVQTLSKFYSSRAVKVYYGRDEVLREHPESPELTAS
jgi:GT2 family glycosyltransferase